MSTRTEFAPVNVQQLATVVQSGRGGHSLIPSLAFSSFFFISLHSALEWHARVPRIEPLFCREQQIFLSRAARARSSSACATPPIRARMAHGKGGNRRFASLSANRSGHNPTSHPTDRCHGRRDPDLPCRSRPTLPPCDRYGFAGSSRPPRSSGRSSFLWGLGRPRPLSLFPWQLPCWLALAE